MGLRKCVKKYLVQGRDLQYMFNRYEMSPRFPFLVFSYLFTPCGFSNQKLLGHSWVAMITRDNESENQKEFYKYIYHCEFPNSCNCMPFKPNSLESDEWLIPKRQRSGSTGLNIFGNIRILISSLLVYFPLTLRKLSFPCIYPAGVFFRILISFLSR